MLATFIKSYIRILRTFVYDICEDVGKRFDPKI